MLALVLFYRDTDRPLPHSIPIHFSDNGFLIGGLYIGLLLFHDLRTIPSLLQCTNLQPDSNHTLFRIMVYLSCSLLWYTFCTKNSEKYNLTVGSSCLLWNYFHPILNLLCLLPILHHFFEFLSWIVGLAGSRNIKFLIIVSCAHALFQLAISNYI
jgi:hypothetical protein